MRVISQPTEVVMDIEKVIEVPEQNGRMSKQKIAKIATLAVAGVVGIAVFALAIRKPGTDESPDSASNEQ